MRQCFFGFEAPAREAKEANEHSLLARRKNFVKPGGGFGAFAEPLEKNSAFFPELSSTLRASVIH